MSPLKSKGMRILIMEEENDSAISDDILLRKWGHDVTLVREASGALRSANCCMPNVVMLYFGLVGSSGYEVARHLKESAPRTSPLVIAVTGSSPESYSRNEADGNIDLRFRKPIDLHLLRSLLERFSDIVHCN